MSISCLWPGSVIPILSTSSCRCSFACLNAANLDISFFLISLTFVPWWMCTYTCRCSYSKRGTMYWDYMQRTIASRSESWRTGSGFSTFSPSHNQWTQRRPTSTRNPQLRWWYTSIADQSPPSPLNGHPVVQTGDQGDTKHHWKGRRLTMVCELVTETLAAHSFLRCVWVYCIVDMHGYVHVGRVLVVVLDQTSTPGWYSPPASDSVWQTLCFAIAILQIELQISLFNVMLSS